LAEGGNGTMEGRGEGEEGVNLWSVYRWGRRWNNKSGTWKRMSRREKTDMKVNCKVMSSWY